MAVISIEQLSPDVTLGLWAINEDETTIDYALYPDLQKIHNTSRRHEKFAVRSLLSQMTGETCPVIHHLPSGKPVIEGWNLSLSHTRGFAAALLSRHHRVAVDIEYMSERVSKIASRFIRPDEDSSTLLHQLINWSAKETVYKFFSDAALRYFEMRLHPFSPSLTGKVAVDNLRAGILVDVSYRHTPDYVLTFACSAE